MFHNHIIWNASASASDRNIPAYGGFHIWLEIYRDIIGGYDSVARLTEAERNAIPYMILANQFVCVAWFAEQDKYAEIFAINKKMTL